MPNLPTGIVTFLFTDIQGSTKIAQTYPDQWETLRGRHHEILRCAIQANNGFVFQIVGDEFCSVFHHPIDALEAALAAQQALQSEKWDPAPIRVRMGINTGAAQVGNVNDPSGGYTGYAALARVNRVMSAGHGGQILLSNSSAELARIELPENVTLLDMGEHRMRGLLSPEHLWQVEAPDLAHDFPPLKTLTSIPNSQTEQLASFVDREKGIAAGLEVLAAELPLRAPVLVNKFNELAGSLQPSIENTYQERFEALKEVNDLSLEALDISFIALCSSETPPAYDARCPFRGLESFQPEDSEFFFGREALTQKLVDKIKAHPFLAVLGASGSGKSSLVMAGLIPALGLDYFIFRPGTNPLNELDFALSSARENTLIVVDQFEETFTLTVNETMRRDFITKLLETTQHHKVIITLRSDFLGEVAPYRQLNEEIQNHLENVPPMNMDELYQSMAGQAGKTGLRFESNLGQDILDDVAGEPGAMPLLQHALWMLWKHRHGLWLKIEEYKNFGGVRQAIASGAEDAYTECSESERERMRDIFLRLTRLDESNEGHDTRRRVLLSDLIHVGSEASSSTLLLDKLANSRLIVKTVKDNQTEVEVAHEALIRHWERLRGWLNEDRNKLRLRESIGESAKEWEKGKRDEAILNHRGGRLDDALLLGGDARYGLTSLEQEYLNECAALRNRVQLARERRLRWTITASASAAIIFLVLGIFGWVQRNEAVAQSKIALARQLAAQSQNMVMTSKSNQSFAFLLAIQSMKIDPSPEASQVLLGKNFAAHSIASMAHDDQVYSLAISPDGRYMVSGGGDHAVRVWEISTGKEITRMKHDNYVYSVALSPDGKHVVSGSWDDTVRVWDAFTGEEISHMTHADDVYVVAFSPDGKHVASGSLDDTARVWEAATGKEVARMQHEGDIYSMAFSPDGKYVVSGSLDYTARVWEASTGKELARMKHDSEVYFVAFSADGTYVASGGWDEAIRVWEPSTGKELTRMKHDAGVNAAVFSPDGKYIVSGSTDKTVRVWEVRTGREVARMIHDGEVYAVAVSRDNQYVASGSTDNTARMWELATGREVARMTHDDYVYSVAFTPDGKYAASGSYDKTIRVWEISKEHVASYLNHNGSILSIAVSPNGEYIASGSSDGVARVWSAGTGKEISQMVHNSDVNSVAFSPDGNYVASGDSDNTARIWEAATGKEVARTNHNAPVWGVTFSPNGKYVASCSEDKTVRVWEAFTGKEIARMTHDNGVFRVVFSPDGKYVASGSWDSTTRMWDAFTGQEILRITHDNYAVAVAFSPDGKYIASGSWDKTIRVVEIATGKEVAHTDHDNEVSSIAFSPDGKHIASGSWDKTVRIWETATGKEIKRMKHDSGVYTLAFSPDGLHLLSGGYDNTARVWEVATGKEIARMAHDNVVRAVAFLPDGRQVVSGGFDKTVRVWEWQTEDLISKACSTSPRNLTRLEWNQYISRILPYEAVCSNLPLEP